VIACCVCAVTNNDRHGERCLDCGLELTRTHEDAQQQSGIGSGDDPAMAVAVERHRRNEGAYKPTASGMSQLILCFYLYAAYTVMHVCAIRGTVMSVACCACECKLPAVVCSSVSAYVVKYTLVHIHRT
jgi:hypothetical protein